MRDTGPGITDLDRERVFDRFFRGRGPNGSGSGLGLAISREIMRALSGTIELDSTVGTGTRVRLQLPAARLVRT